MKIIVVANHSPNNIKELISIDDNDLVIVTDGAFDIAIKQKLRIDLVIGDMDSIDDVKKLKNYDSIILKKDKDETDTFVAIDYAYTQSNTVYLIGGIKGNRIEHFLANLTLFDKFPFLIMIDDYSKIYVLPKGETIIQKTGFISFFAYDRAKISLNGFKYNLDNYVLDKFDPLCISNEVISLYGDINVHEGKVLVIETKK